MINLPTIWEKWNPDICDRDIYRNFNKEIKLDKCDIVKRIGSDSADAEVYHIKYKNINFALKLMPRIDSDSEEKNRLEIETAIKAGSELPKYFPKVFGSGTSDKYVNKSNSLLFKKAEEYSCYMSLLEQLKSKRQKLEFSQAFREGTTLKELIKKFNLESCEKTAVVDYLISELANGDLGNFIKKPRKIYDWNIILFDIITGIYYMATKLKKAHSDLHPGNILIIVATDNCNVSPVKDDQGLLATVRNEQLQVTALLHDFGRAINVTKKNSETYFTGLLSFCKEFLGASKRPDLIVPKQIKKAIIEINEVIIKLTTDQSIELTGKKIYNIYKYVLEIVNNVDDSEKPKRGRSRSRRSKSKSRNRSRKSKKRAHSK